MARIALLSTSDTDLLSARASAADWLLANPSRLDVAALPGLLTDVDLVVVRLLGTPRSWQDGFDVVLGLDVPVLVLGGEQTPDASLMELSTVPVGTAAQAHVYLAQGGPSNLANLHAFCSDTVLLTGEGFEPPAVVPEWGWSERVGGFRQAQSPVVERSRAPLRIGVLFYRAHETSGNAAFAHALADAIDETGEAVGLPIFSSSLRSAPDELF
jgi:cobaltochelatase CobN